MNQDNSGKTDPPPALAPEKDQGLEVFRQCFMALCFIVLMIGTMSLMKSCTLEQEKISAGTVPKEVAH